jgi:hypothetical protein
MASLDALTPDQRAVLDLVLQRGRGYDDIARLLAIDRAAVRARALSAFDAIGPETGISSESRALITDYLLGQLPDRVAEQTRERLAQSPYERAWARMVASELEPLASKPLPEVPDSAQPPGVAAAEPEAPRSRDEAGVGATPGARRRGRSPRRPPRLSDRPSSRRGGAIMLGVGALVVVALVVVLIAVLSDGSSTTHSSAARGSRAASTSTTAPKPQVLAQINLNPPSSSSSAKGIAIVVKAVTKTGTAYGIIIEAAHVPANNHNAYAAWLFNTPTDSVRLGFVNPAVGKNGALQVGSALPANAGHFKQLLLTVETQNSPKAPGPVVLAGQFKGVPASG